MREIHASKARIYLPAKEGGLGLRKFEHASEDAVVYTTCYMYGQPTMNYCKEKALALNRRTKRTVISDFKQICKNMRWT